MSGHTKGPWWVSEKYACHAEIFDSQGFRLAKTVENLPQNVANARLMAAAPDLLEALKLARGYVEVGWGLTNDDTNSQPYKDMAAIDATIAKAEGR